MKDVTCVKETEHIHRTSWDRLAELVSELDKPLVDARAVGRCCRPWWDMEKNWTPFKSLIHKLVCMFGKHRAHLVISTVAAYEVTYWKLHNALARDRRGD